MSEDFPELDANDVEGATLNDDLDKLAELLHEHNTAAKAAEEAASAYRLHRDHCYDRMEAEKVESIRRNGRLFVRNDPTWYSTIQDEAQLRAWLKDNAPQAIGKAKLEEKALNRIVRACKEDGRPFPPGLGSTPRRIVAVRK